MQNICRSNESPALSTSSYCRGMRGTIVSLREFSNKTRAEVNPTVCSGTFKAVYQTGHEPPIDPDLLMTLPVD
jgi:hypothetical protein